jgi:hypothetical protein
MKKVFKTIFIALLLLGCSSKLAPNNQALIDKKSLFNLSSLSIETSHNHISKQPKLGLLLSDESQKRAAESIYFTKFKKGILKLKILSVEVDESKEKTGSFLYFFSSYKKELHAKISYTLSVYSDRNEELKKVSANVSAKIEGSSSKAEKELIEKALDEFQLSIYEVSKTELSGFLTTR